MDPRYFFFFFIQEFKRKFAKPINASGRAKCSDKNLEEGALALQTLHKQVIRLNLRFFRIFFFFCRHFDNKLFVIAAGVGVAVHSEKNEGGRTR